LLYGTFQPLHETEEVRPKFSKQGIGAILQQHFTEKLLSNHKSGGSLIVK